MRSVKRFLLGSAAGVVAVAGAQAADLPVKAKPVQYVKICTLYGDGFYYIPGSDTCIRFAGYVRGDYGFNLRGARNPNYSGATGAEDRTVSRFTTRHRTSLDIDTRTETTYGTLRAYTSFFVQNSDGADTIQATRAFIQWGGFTIGRSASFSDVEGQFNPPSMVTFPQGTDTTSTGVNMLAYTWQFGNGITFNVGIEDNRTFIPIANLSNNVIAVGANPTSARHGTSMPDAFATLAFDQAWGRANVGVTLHNNQATYYTTGSGCAQPNTTLCGYPSDKLGWAVYGGSQIRTDFISPGSNFNIFGMFGVGTTGQTNGLLTNPGLFGGGNQVAWGVSTDAVYVNGSALQQTTSWTVGAAYEHYWTRNFATAAYVKYSEITYNSTVVNSRWFCGGGGGVVQNIVLAAGTTCDPSFHFWNAGIVNSWYPVRGLRFAVEVFWIGVETATSGATITLSKAQGARPTGAYVAKDQGNLAVIFRAQRSWGS